MTATVIPLHRNGTQDLDPEVIAAAHKLWDTFKQVPPEDRAYHRAWLESMFGLGESFDEAIAEKDNSDAAIRDLDDHPSPA